MALVRFSIEADTNDVEPDRIIPKIDREIFDEPGEDSESSVGPKIGHVHALLVLWSRAANEGVSLYDAMDCFSASAEECFAARYREDGHEWSQAVNELYDGAVPGMDALFIEEIQLEPKYRGQGIGADIVRELISTFASTGIALVGCKPFPLQYSDWKADDAEHRKLRKTPGFEEKRIADFARVARFWTELGFLKLKDCDVHTYAPHLRVRPEIPRVPQGRRRLQNKSVAPRRKQPWCETRTSTVPAPIQLAPEGPRAGVLPVHTAESCDCFCRYCRLRQGYLGVAWGSDRRF